MDSIELFQDAIRSGVPKGMRASLETGNLLTGARYIGIDYYEGLEPATHGEYEGYPTIPSIPSGMGQIEKNLNAVLAKIQALPLETTVERSNEALASLDATLESLHGILESDGIQQLPAEVEATLAEVRSVVNGLSPDSELYQSLNSSLAKLNRSLANLESLSRTLAEQPNAAVMPSKSTPDPMPEVRQ